MCRNRFSGVGRSWEGSTLVIVMCQWYVVEGGGLMGIGSGL